MPYTGTVDLISGIRPKNNGTFALVDAKDVRIDDNTRLSDMFGGSATTGIGAILQSFTTDSNGYICQINGGE